MSEIKTFRTNFYILEKLFANLDSDFSRPNTEIINTAISYFLKQPDFTKFRKTHSGKKIEFTHRMPYKLKEEMEKFFPDKSKIANKALEMYYYPDEYPEFDINEDDIEKRKQR